MKSSVEDRYGINTECYNKLLGIQYTITHLALDISLLNKRYNNVQNLFRQFEYSDDLEDLLIDIYNTKQKKIVKLKEVLKTAKKWKADYDIVSIIKEYNG